MEGRKRYRRISLVLVMLLLLNIISTPLGIFAQGEQKKETENTNIAVSNKEQFLCDEGLSPEEYQIIKSEYLKQFSDEYSSLMKTAVLNDNMLSNEYIEFAVNPNNGRFTVGTTGGNPELSTDDNKRLLYGHASPSTSYTTINVDGKVYKYGDAEFISSPKFINNSNVSEAKFDNVRVSQNISLVKNSSTMREDVVEIKYVVHNEGTSSVDFGLRIMMDTMLGNNDAAPFRIPGSGDVTTEMEFDGDSIPQYWQAFDSLSNPSVVSYGNFISGKIKPSKVQFTNWGRVYNTPWNYSVSRGHSNGDSAVSIIWNRSLNPGQEETYVTRYGLSELLQELSPPLAVTVAADSMVQIDSSANKYVPYTITTYIQNTGNAPAINAMYKLDLPNELNLQNENDSEVINLGTIEVGEVKRIDKVVLVKDIQGKERNTSYTVSVSADNCRQKSLLKQLVIPKLESKAIIVIPGIAGSRLYTNQEVDTKDYLSTKFQKKKHYFTFETGYQLWEPYTSTTANKLQSITTQQNRIQSEVMMLLCDENGNSQIDIMSDELGKKGVYGAQNTYQKLVNSLEENFKSSGYNVSLFSYDWRLSNKKSAVALEEYIEEKGYTDVILVCHSMGGLVASEYIKNSTANKDKVEKLITLGTPYLGAPKALYVFETGHFLDWASSTFCMATPLKEVSGNIAGIYQLLPSKAYFDLNSTTYIENYNNNGFWGKAKKEKLNYQKTYNLIANRSWAKNSTGKVKPMLANAEQFYNGLLVNNSSHVINTVDSYVVIGYGKDTVMEVREEFNKDGSYESCKDLTILNGGDGTVPLISANIGGLSPSDKTYYIIENHTGLVSNQDVLSLVNKIIDNKPDTYASSITKTQPTVINEKGWFGRTKNTRVKIKIECPVTLSMIGSDGEPWAYVSNDLIYNEDNNRGVFYTLGNNNDTKIAYLQDMDNSILLTGTGKGSMTYTASIIEDGYEIKRVIFENVPLTETTLISTNTDFEKGIQLELDFNGDGIIDSIVAPSKDISGSDIENEHDLTDGSYSNYGLISKNKQLSTSLSGKDLKLSCNILSNGIVSLLSKTQTINGEINGSLFLLNGRIQEKKESKLEENLELELQNFIKENLKLYNSIVGSKSIGKICFITKYVYSVPNEITTKDNLVITTDKVSTINPSIIYSADGNITITSKDINLEGIIYAPNGIITITGTNIKFNGIMIADRIIVNGRDVEIKNELNLQSFDRE